MKIRTTCALLFFTALYGILYAQEYNLEIQSVTSGAHPQLNNGTQFISGSFGQVIANSQENGTSGGFFAAASSFLQENTAPRIRHLTNQQFTSFDFTTGPTFSVDIDDLDGIREAYLVHRGIGEEDFDSILLVLDNDVTYSTSGSSSDPAFDAMGIEYYFSAIDNTDLYSRVPEGDLTLYAYASQEEITFPSDRISRGNTEQNYRIISTPYTVNDNAASELFSVLTQGEWDNSQWRLYAHNGGEQFNEFPNGSARTLVPGKGYWMIVSTGSAGEIRFTEADNEPIEAPNHNQSSLFNMSLQSGWNMVGNPYAITISWDDVLAYNGDLNIGPLLIYTGDAASAGYEEQSELEPFEGGVVFIPGDQDLMVPIPFRGQVAEGSKRLTERFSSDPSEDNWMLPIEMLQGRKFNHIAAVGMHEEASKGWDRFDNINPPRFQSYLEMRFAQDIREQAPHGKDIVPISGINKWEIEINSSSEEPITLNWDNSDFSPFSPELYLFDLQTEQIVDMRNDNSAVVNNNSKLEIYYGQGVLQEMGPKMPFFDAPFPNPVSQEATVTFPLNLSGKDKDYQVTAHIYRMNGQIVSSFFNDQLPSGSHVISWDGLDRSNRAAHSGMYIYQLNIESTSRQWQFTGKLLVAK